MSLSLNLYKLNRCRKKKYILQTKPGTPTTKFGLNFELDFVKKCRYHNFIVHIIDLSLNLQFIDALCKIYN